MSTQDQAAQLAEHVDELVLYWPALTDALDRDQGGAASATAVATSSPVLSAPVNLDVLRATSTMEQEVPTTAAWCASVVAEQSAARPVAGHLPHFPRWHARMVATAAVRGAERLAITVAAWRSLCKRAIGLLVADRPLGEYCPRHDQPLTELVAPGDEGWLTLRAGEPGPTVSWIHVHAVVCRRCGSRWAPSQYLWLGRLIRDAARRRAQPDRAEAA